jgi:hypothetical protein
MCVPPLSLSLCFRAFSAWSKVSFIVAVLPLLITPQLLSNLGNYPRPLFGPPPVLSLAEGATTSSTFHFPPECARSVFVALLVIMSLPLAL